MQKYILKFIFFVILNLVCRTSKTAFDLTLIGPLHFADGLGRSTIILMDMLKRDLRINFICSREKIRLTDVVSSIRPIIMNPDTSPGKVSLLVDALWYTWHPAYLYVPTSDIKIAYSMLESTEIPQQWVTILNNQFDAVVVPDKFLVQVYKQSDVKIPIFLLPCGLYLEEFLNHPQKKQKNTPFVFGMSATLTPRKNYLTLVKAFAQEFGNNPLVQLKLHARSTDKKSLASFKQIIKHLHLNNVELTVKSSTQQEYLEFMKSLDCYILLSKGEGFSITPREALALGIPCILSKNTAHTTICNTGLVRAVPSLIMEPAYYSEFKKHIGYYFNCKINDVREAMRDVYSNYEHYLSKAVVAREWVQQYTLKNLRPFYLNLIKPKKVTLGHYNSINEHGLITNSKELYRKYINLVVRS